MINIYCPKATKSVVIGLFICAISVGGGLTRGGRCLGWLRRANQVETATALNAAPRRVRLVLPSKRQLTQLTIPPEYVRSAFLSKQPSQLIPSSWKFPLMVAPWIKTLGMGGRTGTALGPDTNACARVDAWLPESMNRHDVITTPDANDPNAKITLDITPPLKRSGGDCAVWVYHYGTPPSKPRRKAVPRRSRHDRINRIASQE